MRKNKDFLLIIATINNGKIAIISKAKENTKANGRYWDAKFFQLDSKPK